MTTVSEPTTTAITINGVQTTLSMDHPNLLAALREGDYSLRTRVPNRRDALGLILAEVNALGQSFQEQRLDALEAFVDGPR